MDSDETSTDDELVRDDRELDDGGRIVDDPIVEETGPAWPGNSPFKLVTTNFLPPPDDDELGVDSDDGSQDDELDEERELCELVEEGLGPS